MGKYIKLIFVVVFFSSYGFASDKLSGYVGGMAGKYIVKDNFEYDKENDTINSLNSAKEYDKNYVLPIFDLEYKNFFTKTDVEDFDVKLGYSWKENNSVYLMLEGVGIAQEFKDKYFYKLHLKEKKMYLNPYQIKTKRDTKKASIIDFDMGMKNLYDYIDLTYTYNSVKIDDKVNSDTKQTGHENTLDAFFYLFDFNEESYGGLGAFIGNSSFDGQSNEYKKAGAKYAMDLTYNYLNKFEFEVAFAKYNFDEKNSYFNKIRDEKELQVVFLYTRYNLFENSKLFGNITAYSNKKESNIDFFDKQEKALFLSMGYIF